MPNAKVGAVPQPSMRQDQHGKKSKVRGRQSTGITMEDLKHQTAVRLAQEQARRPIIAASNKKSSRRIGFLPSNPLYNRKRSDDKVKSIDSRSNASSTEVGQASSSIWNWSRKSSQPSSAMNNSRHMLSSSQKITNLNQNRGRIHVDKRVDMGPSEQYQQQVNHHYHSPVKSQSIYDSHEVKSQQDAIPSMKYKKHMPSKSYRHGLTVQELKEMTRSRLAAEASGNEVTNHKSSTDPVRQMAKDTHQFQGRLSHNHFDVANGGRLRPTELSSSDQSTGQYQSQRLSCNANTNGNMTNGRFANGQINKVAQQQTKTYPLCKHGNGNTGQDLTTYAQGYQDNLLSLHDSYLKDGFDNSSVHSFNSGFGSDYLRSENSYFTSSLNDSLSSAGGALENENRRSNSDILRRKLFPSGKGSPTLSSSAFLNAYQNTAEIQRNDSFQSSSDSHVSSHSPAIQSLGPDSVYSGILAKDSSETLPTMNLSADSHYDSEESCFVPLNFGSPTLTNSYDSEEKPNLHVYGRKQSDGALSRNGDLPNSVAESVLTPLFLPEIQHNSTAGVFRHTRASTRHLYDDRHTNNPLRTSVESSYMVDDIYNRKSWEETDDVSIAQFLDDFESRLNVDCKPEGTLSSIFVSKIDPEVTKHNGVR